MSFLEDIQDHVQEGVPFSENQKKFDRICRNFFPVTEDIVNWKKQMMRLVNPGGQGVTNVERNITGPMIQKIQDSGVFEELAALRSSNSVQTGPRRLFHIPMEHWSKEGVMTESSVACLKDVNAIVAAAREVNPTRHKFFMEGSDLPGRVTLEGTIESIAWTYEKRGIQKDPSTNKGPQFVQDTFPWVFDPKYLVYGTEHQAFFEVYTRYTDAPEYKQRVTPVSANTFDILLNHLLREQIAVERALSKLEAGDEGYLVYGAGHTRSLDRYLNTRRYKGVSYGTLVPKGLVKSKP